MRESRVLITGCGGTGIGRTTALELKARGHTVIASARDGSTIADLDVDLRLELDVADDASIRRALEAAGPVTALVNNAARVSLGPIESVPVDDVRHMLEIYVAGPLLLMQGVIPGMRERGHGTIVNVTSSAGLAPAPLTGGYSAAKAALGVLSEVLAMEVRPFGIRVCTVVPGGTRSELSKSVVFYGRDDPHYKRLVDGFFRARESTGPEVVAREIACLIEGPVEEVHHIAPEQVDVAPVVNAHRNMSSAEYARFILARFGAADWW